MDDGVQITIVVQLFEKKKRFQISNERMTITYANKRNDR